MDIVNLESMTETLLPTPVDRYIIKTTGPSPLAYIPTTTAKCIYTILPIFFFSRSPARRRRWRRPYRRSSESPPQTGTRSMPASKVDSELSGRLRNPAI